jgi:hypothetical protein
MFSSRSRGGNWQNPANNFLGKERRKTTDKEELSPAVNPDFSNALLIFLVEEGDWYKGPAEPCNNLPFFLHGDNNKKQNRIDVNHSQQVSLS